MLRCEGERNCKVLDPDGNRDRGEDDIELPARILCVICGEYTGVAYSAEDNALGLVDDGELPHAGESASGQGPLEEKSDAEGVCKWWRWKLAVTTSGCGGRRLQPT